MRFLHVRLDAPAHGVQPLADFYSHNLGIDAETDAANELTLSIGETTLEFVSTAGEPFYHFALLVPGNRFEAALEWARERTELLPDPESGELVFDFDNWAAQACYFHDPAANIVELIAHRGVDETAADGPLRPTELVGLSELGLVGDPAAMARPLEDALALRVWDGGIDDAAQLAFVGERARTLILAPEGRGWLPTGRPAEPHRVEALVSGQPDAEVRLLNSRHRVVRSASRGRL